LTVTSQMTGAGLTKSGGGTVVLTHANSFTGPLSINGGDVSVTADNQFGNAANSISMDAGALTANAGFTMPRNVALATGGGMISVFNNLSTLTASGQFSGSGALTTSGTGTVVLTNINNNYDGGTTIAGGTLRIASDSVLGTTIRTLTFAAGNNDTPT